MDEVINIVRRGSWAHKCCNHQRIVYIQYKHMNKVMHIMFSSRIMYSTKVSENFKLTDIMSLSEVLYNYWNYNLSKSKFDVLHNMHA